MTVIAFQSRTRKGALELAKLLSAVCFWSLFYAFELLSPNPAWILFWAKIEYFFIVTIGPAWFFFAVSLSPWEKLKTAKIHFLVFLVPVLVLLFVWTNEFHHLFWSQHQIVQIKGIMYMRNYYGPVFWIHLGYSYLLIGVATFILFYRFMMTEIIGRHQFIYLLIPLFPFFANIIPYLYFNPLPGMDLTPLGFTLSGLILLWGGIRRFQLEIVPIARKVVMDNIEDGLIIMGYQGEVIDSNRAAFEISGFKSNIEIQAFFLNGFIQQGQNTGQIQIELDGVLNRPHVLMRITPVLGKKRPAGWVVVLTDITGQKQAAFELKESKERYETIFRGMRDAIIVRDLTGHILDANPAACEMYGYPREEFLQKTIADLMGEYRSLLFNIENVSQIKLSEMPDFLLHTSNFRANGEVFPVEIQECPILISGETLILLVVRDVTDKVKTESALKSRERYLRLLNKITWDALAGSNLQEILGILSGRLGELFDSNGAYITLWNEEKQSAVSGAYYDPERESCEPVSRELNPKSLENKMTQVVLESGQPVIIEENQDIPYSWAEILNLSPAGSLLTLPLIAGDRKLGAILITLDGMRSLNEEDLAWGTQAADQIALVISRAYLMEKTQELLAETQSINETLEQKIQERTEQLVAANQDLEDEIRERHRIEAVIRTRLELEHLISNLSSRFMDSYNFDSVLSDALQAIGYITGGTRVAMFMIRPNGGTVDNTHEWQGVFQSTHKENLQNIPISNLAWWMKTLYEKHLIQIEDPAAIPAEALNELQILRADGIRSLLCYPISYDFKLAGFVEIDNLKTAKHFPMEDIELLALLVRTISSALYRKQSQERLKRANEELRTAYDATIEGWARALELRERETAGHCERTVDMALKLAWKLGIEGEELENIRRGALLHDIGKMVVPDYILQKPGPLTDEERSIIYEHPLYSAKMLGQIDYLKPAVAIPFYHHEKWDGSGYPNGLKGEDIPLAARLFALVDVWDALSSDRPYRKALPEDEVLAIIEKGVGSHFDPVIGPIFLEMLKKEQTT
jgi:PAS domain S-box-containing protein/putative nucleotidyltransferase with HDIG domain